MSEPLYWGDMRFVFVSDFYDMPLNGICLCDGKLCEFDGDYDTGAFTIKPPAWWQKVFWLWRKRLFEICVGHHWTYDASGKERSAAFSCRSPRWLYRALFKAYYWRSTLRNLRRRK
jgi:hypothetical protein